MSELLRHETITELHAAVELARCNPEYLTALSGAGPVSALEDGFRQRLGVPYALGVSSGTAALHTALVACGVRPGDEVIVPAYTWPQTIAPLVHMGAIPVVVDVALETFLIDPAEVAKAVTDRTRAVIAVHMFGRPALLSDLVSICRRQGIFLIEDAAHAFGAATGGIPVGAWGDAACFSLGRSKPVTAGEGGVLVTSTRDVFERAVGFSQHPLRQEYELTRPSEHDVFGMNYRIHPLAATIAVSEMRFSETARQQRADWVHTFIGALGRFTSYSSSASNNDRHAWYRLPLVIMTSHASINRNQLLETLRGLGLAANVGPIREPMHVALKNSPYPFRSHPCPCADELCSGRAIIAEIALGLDPTATGNAVAGVLSSNRTHVAC